MKRSEVCLQIVNAFSRAAGRMAPDLDREALSAQVLADLTSQGLEEDRLRAMAEELFGPEGAERSRMPRAPRTCTLTSHPLWLGALPSEVPYLISFVCNVIYFFPCPNCL